MYQLVADVLDHAPATLTPAEVLVLVAIAEDTRTPGEHREIPTEDLTRRTRLDRRGLRDAVTRLAKRGIRVRVAIGTDRRGMPLYAVPGKAPRWVLPSFPAPPDCECRPCRQGGVATPPPPVENPVDSQSEGGATPPPSTNGQVNKEATQLPLDEKEEPQLRQAELQRRQPEPQLRQPDATAPPSPYVAKPVIYQRPPTVAYLLDHTDADDEEAQLLIKTIKARHSPRSIGAYIRGMPIADLAELLADIRDRHSTVMLPPPCGQCGPGRLRELPDGTPFRCPDCHPRALEATG